MPLHSTIQNLERIRSTFQTMRLRYFILVSILVTAMSLGQWLVQQKLVQIGTTYEALSDIQQLYEVGNLLQPKGLMIASTQSEFERKQQIQGFANNVDIYLQLYSTLRNNTDYHEVFRVSDTVKHRIYRLDKENTQIRNYLPILADSISIDSTFNRIAAILLIQHQSERELSTFVRGYKLELQQMRQYLQYLSFSLYLGLLISVFCEIFLIFLPLRSNSINLLDTTEQLQNELSSALQKITHSTSRYELLVNQAHDCVYQLDTRGRFVFANTASAKLLGYDSAMLLETYYLDYVHPDFRRSVMVEYQRQYDQESSDAMTFPIVDAQGNMRWVEQTFTKLFDNQMFVGFLGIARDITERKEIQASFEELALSHSLVLESITSAVITTDMNGIIKLFNNAASYLLGYEAEELLETVNITALLSNQGVQHQHISTKQIIGVELFNNLDAMFANAERYGTHQQRVTLLTKYGNVVPVEMNISLLKDTEDKAKGLLITAQDISEQQQLEEIKQEFISRVSHEMRTPLHGIMGMIEVLRTSPLTDEQLTMLDIAQSKSDVLLTLINDILEYSKIQTGSLEILRVATDMSIFISNISEVLQERLFVKNIRLKVHLSQEIPLTIYCDPVRLYQIILSLTDNIMQFTTGGNICIDFDYLSQKEGLFINIYSIESQINIDVQRKVFTPFIDEHSSKEKFHSAGLQISLLRGIIQQMGGVLWLEHHPETGATFSFFLSIEKEKTEKELILIPEYLQQVGTNVDFTNPKFHSSAFQQKGIHILIVDDDNDNRSLAMTFLANIGNENLKVFLHTANDGVEAVTQFNTNVFNIILMDIQMPIMDGFEATRLIREQERINNRKRTPIIATTANVMENYREKCLQAGMDDYISKPMKKKHLLDTVGMWLEERKTILLVDDSEDFSLILQLQFEKSNRYHLLVAHDGKQAIELFQKHDVHAIVMDMEMPILNGYEATKVIRQMPKGLHIPIYAMTAHEGKKELDRILEVGCTQYFTKIGLDTINQVIITLDEYFDSFSKI
jgi:PAS domain S-box-containing protein